MTIDVDLDQLAEVGLSGFSTVKLLFPSPFLYSTLRKEIIIYSPYLRSAINAPHPWGWNIYINYLELLCTHLSLLPILIYSSFILVWTHGYFFALCYNQILFYFFCSNCSSLAIRSSFSCLLCSFGIPPSMVGRTVCFVCLGHFLPFWQF